MQSILASAASPYSTIVFSLRSSCLGDLEWAGFIPRFARDSAALGIRRAKLAERRPSRIERARHCERQGVETRPSFVGLWRSTPGNVGRARYLDCFVAALLAMTIPARPALPARHGLAGSVAGPPPRRNA